MGIHIGEHIERQNISCRGHVENIAWAFICVWASYLKLEPPVQEWSAMVEERYDPDGRRPDTFCPSWPHTLWGNTCTRDTITHFYGTTINRNSYFSRLFSSIRCTWHSYHMSHHTSHVGSWYRQILRRFSRPMEIPQNLMLCCVSKLVSVELQSTTWPKFYSSTRRLSDLSMTRKIKVARKTGVSLRICQICSVLLQTSFEFWPSQWTLAAWA